MIILVLLLHICCFFHAVLQISGPFSTDVGGMWAKPSFCVGCASEQGLLVTCLWWKITGAADFLGDF
jgi:hypothetical protein